MYTLYLDESGEWGYPNYDPEEPILCLCGCIVHDDYYLEKIIPSFTVLKKKNFGKADIVLHRYKVQQRKGEFRKLKTEKRRDACMSNIAQFIANYNIQILIAALDKVEYHKTYGINKVDQWLPKDIYSMLFTFIIERFLAFLQEYNKVKGKIIAERRGRKEDNKIQHWYSCILQHGTQFYHGWQFQKVLPTNIEFRKKEENITGLQISDWIAPTMRLKVQFPDGSQDRFNEWELYKNKIWIGKDAPGRGQIGFKTFPQKLGRKLLNMPLKSE